MNDAQFSFHRSQATECTLLPDSIGLIFTESYCSALPITAVTPTQTLMESSFRCFLTVFSVRPINSRPFFFAVRYAASSWWRNSLFPLCWPLLNRIQQIKSELKVLLHLPQFPFFLRVVQYLCCLPLSFLVSVCFFLAKSWSNALRKPLHESGKSVNRWGKTLLSVNKPELCLVTMKHKQNSSRVRPTYLRMYLCSKSVFRSRYSSQTRLCDNPVTWSAVWFYKNTEKSSRLDFKPTSAPASLWFCIFRHSQGKLLIRGWKVIVSCY